MATSSPGFPILRCPVEVLTHIITQADTFEEAVRWRLLSRTFRDFVDRFEDAILFAIACKYGYGVAGNSGAGAVAAVDLDAAGSALDLVKNAQPSLSDVFVNCKNWKQYLLAQFAVEENWRSIRYRTSIVYWSRPAPRGERMVWRIKLDTLPKRRSLFASTKDGRVRLIGPSRREDAPFFVQGETEVLVGSPYPHVEYSDGMLVTAVDDTFLVMRRGIFSPDDLPQEFWPICALDDGSVEGFQKYRVIRPMVPMRAFKARKPFLIAASDLGQSVRVSLWRLADPASIPVTYTWPKRDDPGVTYVEVDDRYGYVAGLQRIHAVRTDGHGPPPVPFWVKPLDPIHMEDERLMVSAMHHDGKGGHFLAIVEPRLLFWTPRIWKLVETPSADRWRHCVFVSLGMGNPTNLCVENGRALITVQFENLSTLVALDLFDWTDHDDFRRHAPRVKLISWILPAISHISRLEADTTSCYFTGTPALLEDPEMAASLQRMRATWERLLSTNRDAEMRWFTMINEDLGPAWTGSTDLPVGGLADVVGEFGDLTGGLVNDGVIRLDFADAL